jgi:cell division protease FtsH
MSRDFAKARLAVLMGGRVAEELTFGQFTTGAGNDIEKATDIARKMVCEWGMSEKLGPLAYGRREEQVFLGKDYGSRQADYSEQTAVEIDHEIRFIVGEQYKRVKLALQEHKDKLTAIANALMERETLDAEEILAVFENREMPKRERVIIPSYADKAKTEKEKRKVASIFGGPPKPATSG